MHVYFFSLANFTDNCNAAVTAAAATAAAAADDDDDDVSSFKQNVHLLCCVFILKGIEGGLQKTLRLQHEVVTEFSDALNFVFIIIINLPGGGGSFESICLLS